MQPLIVKIADQLSPTLTVQKCVHGLAQALEKELKEKAHKDFILDTIFKCALSLPTKTAIYAV
jgi:hypothetical protein